MASCPALVNRQSGLLVDTLTPFLYPCLFTRQYHIPLVKSRMNAGRHANYATQRSRKLHTSHAFRNAAPTTETSSAADQLTSISDYGSHLNPTPDSYATTPFADRCTLTVHAGSGGHGCVSFLREKYIDQGPANGGDGGSGGNIYIQAVRDETSLHKLSRRGTLTAGRGRNGRGKGQGGERGEDVLFTVPVGTVVRELWRVDPVEEENLRVLEEKRRRKAIRAALQASAAPETSLDSGEATEHTSQHHQEDADADSVLDDDAPRWKKEKWIAYPGMTPREMRYMEAPMLPRRRTSVSQALQPTAPIRLDLDTPIERPLLLAAGASGGVGNPHFVTPTTPRPKFATRGDPGMRMALSLELKMLADVGLVGLPNAGKSTLLRAISASRTRVGSWAFTTLQPVIGTVVLDTQKGRPSIRSLDRETGEQRTRVTVADIPGLIEDAHQDKGLGLGFLRHVERAKVLAFVVDLSAGDAVAALKALWKEVGAYETMRSAEVNAESEQRLDREAHGWIDGGEQPQLPPLALGPISAKPWFVVASKADCDGTQAEFQQLAEYVAAVRSGSQPHPSGRRNAWRKGVAAVPVSARRGEGVGVLPGLIVKLLDDA